MPADGGGRAELRIIRRIEPGQLALDGRTGPGVVVRADGGERFYRDDQLVRIDGQPLIKLGLLTVLRSIHWPTLIAALALFGGTPLFAGLRWRGLLEVQQVRLSAATALKLTWIGLFFNQFMIGTVGGDLVKAYYVTRHTDTAKAESVLTILIDRIIGMLGLLWLSGAGILIWLAVRPGGQGLPHGLPWAWVIGIVAVLLLGACTFFNEGLRRRLGIAARLGRLPDSHLVRRLDRAVRLYWHHKPTVLRAFGWTLLSHVCLLGATYLVARSLGMYADVTTAGGLLHTFTVATIIFVGAGLIPSLAGLGPLEGGFVLFFSAKGIGAQAQALMLALSYRVQILLWSLPGAAMLAVGSHLPSRAEMKRVLTADSP